MLITNSNNFQTGVRRRTIGRSFSVGPVSVKVLTILILAAAALFYLAQTTQSATKNYKLRELEIQKSQLKEENERLQVEAIRLKSLNTLAETAKQMGMENKK